MASESTSNELFKQIQKGKKRAFDEVYLIHFENLKRFAFQYVRNEEVAEEIVSERFVQLWLRRAALADIQNPIFYLYRSVKNACLTHLQREKKHAQISIDEIHQDDLQATVAADPEKLLEYKELVVYLDEVIDNLPDQRKLIFKLVKEERLKCREVADLLGLSVRTVENQVYLAVKLLNEEVTRYFSAGNNPDGTVGRIFLGLI